MPQRIYGIGIIGAGRIFTEHARAVNELSDRLKLVAVADTDPIKLSHATDQYGIPITTTDHHDVIQRHDVDIVAICTPPVLHERMIADALEAGKHVVCEKPLAHSIASADRINALAQQHPGRLSVVYQLRYVPDVQKILWLRDNGRLGDLAFGHFIRFDAIDPLAVDWWGRWQTAGGGVAMTQFIHQLDLACHVFGQPREVHAHMGTFAAGIESEDTFTATIRFESGAVASCSATLCAQAPMQQWHIFGTRGSVANPFAAQASDPAQLDRDLQQLDKLYPPLSPPTAQPAMHIPARAFRKLLRILHLGGHVTPPRPAPLHTPYYRAVLDAVDQGKALPVSPEETLPSLELCTAIYISGITGETIQLPLDRGNPYCQGFSAHDYQANRFTAAQHGDDNKPTYADHHSSS